MPKKPFMPTNTEARATGDPLKTGRARMTDVASLADEVDAMVVAVPTVDHGTVALPLLERGIQEALRQGAVNTGDTVVVLSGYGSATGTTIRVITI